MNTPTKILALTSVLVIAASIYSKATEPVGDSIGKIPVDPPVEQTRPEGKPGVWASAVFTVTAYCPCEKCCGEFADGITASGMPVDGPVTHFLAAPLKIPFGTVFRIHGYNDGAPVVVLDRMPGDGNKIDCYFADHNSALRFGRQILTVKYWKQEKADGLPERN